MQQRMKGQFTKIVLTIVGGIYFGTVQGKGQSTLDYSTTIDLSDPTSPGIGQSSFQYDFFNEVTPFFNLNPGDTISGTISFANNQSLLIQDPTASNFENIIFSFFFFGNNNMPEDFSTTINLLGVDGQLNENTQNGTSTSSTILTIASDGSPGGLTDSSLSFSGFSYSATLSSLGTNSIVLMPIRLIVNTGIGDISITPTPAPEPPPFALVW